jgi:hypothetical protein
MGCSFIWLLEIYLCNGLNSGFRGTVVKGNTASQEQWDGHTSLLEWLYSDKCNKGLKAPNWSKILTVTWVFILLELDVGMRERVGAAWSHDAIDKALGLKVHCSVSWKCTGLAEISEYSDSEISWTFISLLVPTNKEKQKMYNYWRR